MPIDFSGVVDACSADTTLSDAAFWLPSHFAAGSAIAAASASSVLFVVGRISMCVTSFHGSTSELLPKPNAQYASAAVIATWLEPSGTAKTYGWFGPRSSITSGGFGGAVVHALVNSAEFAMSSGVAASSVHVGGAVAGS